MTKELFFPLFLLLLAGSVLVACDSSGPGTDEDPGPDDSAGIPNTILVTPSEATIGEGSTQQFTAEVKDAQDNTLEGISVIWESANEAVAVIDSDGQAEGMAGGTAAITASAESVRGTAVLTIEASGGTSEPGKSWESLDRGFNAYVHALTVDANGNLVAGGRFTQTGGSSGTVLNGIARWNGSSWEPIGSGFNDPLDNPVEALITDSNGDLIAGGTIDQVGDGSFTSVNHIARWDGSSWKPMDEGFNRGVRALIVGSNGGLIAGGSFETVSDFFNYGSPPDRNRVVRWNGSSWETLGNGLGLGLGSEVEDFTVAANGDLIAGGSFEKTGDGLVVNNVARWDGTSWKAIGDGLANSVSALATSADGDLIAAGGYSVQENSRFGYVTRWDGSSWIPIGQELNGWVEEVIIADNGDLIVGGWFTETADGSVTGLNSIARWNGSSWEALGTGLSALFDIPSVFALTTDTNGNLIAGGSFNITGDEFNIVGNESVILNMVARWNPD